MADAPDVIAGSDNPSIKSLRADLITLQDTLGVLRLILQCESDVQCCMSLKQGEVPDVRAKILQRL